MYTSLKPKIVVTIHGIQTRGVWQKNITPYLAQHGLVPYHIDYGWFSFLQFLIPRLRERQVEKTRDEIRNLVERLGQKRISVIAHSFGTYLAMEALERENGQLMYDRVVLTGSIVRHDFDWQRIISRNKWVLAVRNERATSDWVVDLADFISRRLHWVFRLKASNSGRKAFKQKLPDLLDDFVVGNHSEMNNNPLKYAEWARFIAYPFLPDDILNKIRSEMSALQQDAASLLEEDTGNIRVNFFAPIEGALRIVPGAIMNMTYAPEFDLKIMPGEGATGTAFETGNVCIVTKAEAIWSGRGLPDEELKKINRSLKWVISLPIWSASRNMKIGVISVDGLRHIPNVLGSQNADAFELKAIIVALAMGFTGRFQSCLDIAFRGERLPQMEV